MSVGQERQEGDKEKRKRGGGGRGGGRQDSSETSPITRAEAGRSCAWIHLSGAQIKTAECPTARLTPPASLPPRLTPPAGAKVKRRGEGRTRSGDDLESAEVRR